MHPVASFHVKNKGVFPVIIASDPSIPMAPVEVLPGETSVTFHAIGEYSITSRVEKKPLPPPQLLVGLKSGHLDAKAINAPSVNVDLIANFDFSTGDPVFPSHTT